MLRFTPDQQIASRRGGGVVIFSPGMNDLEEEL